MSFNLVKDKNLTHDYKLKKDDNFGTPKTDIVK